MTCRHFQRLLRSSVQLALSNSCSKKYFGTSPAKFKLELSNRHDVFYHRSYIASIKNITRLSCTPGLVQLLYRCLEWAMPRKSMQVSTKSHGKPLPLPALTPPRWKRRCLTSHSSSPRPPPPAGSAWHEKSPLHHRRPKQGTESRNHQPPQGGRYRYYTNLPPRKQGGNLQWQRQKLKKCGTT